MKKMDIFCKSPSSTAICSSLDHRSMVRHHYHSAPSTPKLTTPIFAPCSSSHDLIPFNPSDNLRRRSTSAVAVTDLYKKPSASDKPKQSTTTSDLLLRRRSSADVADLLRLRHRRHRSHSESSAHLLNHDAPAAAPPPYSNWVSGSAPPDQQTRNKIKLKRSSVYDYAPVREIERRHSSASGDPTHEPKRTGLIGWVRSDSYRKHDAASEITPAQQQAENNNNNNTQLVKSQDCPPVAHPPPDVQVVELRVSIHCKGCEGKVRKHISKMEGVTSFSIDVTTKKVTVKGNVTPMAVLSSISKVKSAQLWSTTSGLPPRPPAPATGPGWAM